MTSTSDINTYDDDDLIPHISYLDDSETEYLLDRSVEQFTISDDEAASRLLTASVISLLPLGFDPEAIGDLAEEFANERERRDAEDGRPSLRILGEEHAARLRELRDNYLSSGGSEER